MATAATASLLVAVLAALLSGCIGDGGLAAYTSASYETPVGFSYPDPSWFATVGQEAPAGMRTNPGAIDVNAGINPVFPGSTVNATAGYAAYLQSTVDPNVTVVSAAVRLARPLLPEEIALYEAVCRASGTRSEATLLDGEVLAFIFWSPVPVAKQAGEQLLEKIVAKTGALRICVEGEG